MLHFSGYGQKNNIQKSRDEIIKTGLDKNADIFKVNRVLESFNTQVLTVQEALEYIIKDSLDNMNIHSPAPQLSDFGITSSELNKIGNYKNLYFLNIITVLFVSWFISSNLGNNGIIFILLSAYFLFGFWYFNFNENYKNTIVKINMYNSVNRLYYEKHKQLEDEIQRIQAEEQARIRKHQEEERIRREQIERQQLDYWKSILNNKSLSTSERGQIFEKEMTKLFKQLGWEVKLTQASKDGGVDIILDMKGDICLVQCKFHKGKIGVEPVRALWGVKDSFNANRVMMLAYAGATQGGIDFAREKNRGKNKEDWVYKICDIHDVIRWYSMAEKR